MQVARRIGKSIATVRRMEGNVLNPTRDARGVHRFDVDEVERVAFRGHGLPPVDRPGRSRADSEDDGSEVWHLEDKLREAKHRAWRAEHALERARREQQADGDERRSREERAAELTREVEALRSDNGDLKQVVARVGELLIESGNDDFHDLGGCMLALVRGGGHVPSK